MRLANLDDIKWVKTSKKLSGEEIPEDEILIQTFARFQEVMILEDHHPKFQSGFGPVGVVAAISNGYLYQPHVEWFHWATPRNKLRSAVMFFQKFRYRKLGVIRVHALKDAEPFFKRLKDYVPLYFAGKIPGGDELGRGDDHIFFMKCRGSYEWNI